jgi:hypothetical protein
MYFIKKHTTHFGIPFATPGTSAAIALWTDEKSRCLAETTKAVTVTKTYSQELPCNDFYTLISDNPKLLQEIRSSMKYKTSAQEEGITTSTLTRN